MPLSFLQVGARLVLLGTVLGTSEGPLKRDLPSRYLGDPSKVPRRPTVEFLPGGHSSRSLGTSELLPKVLRTRSHALESLETTQNLMQKLLRGFLGARKSGKVESRD